jgi:HAE1 family hydrophobic/amphiphilic exporter-1
MDEDKIPGIFKAFNVGLEKVTGGYSVIVKASMRKAALGIILFLAISGVAIHSFGKLPTGFVPQEDEGFCIVNVQLPNAASQPRIVDFVKKTNKIIEETPGVARYITVTGYSLFDDVVVPNMAFSIVVFKDWDERDESEHQTAIINNLNRKFMALKDGIVFSIPTPSLPGLGLSGGFTAMLQDRGGVGLDVLEKSSLDFIAKTLKEPAVKSMNSTFKSDVPQLKVDIDRDSVLARGLTMKSVFDTLQVYLGSAYINDFNIFGRTYQVNMQADNRFRNEIEDLYKIEIRNRDGKMVPIGSLLKISKILGPQIINRYNLYPSSTISGSAATGYSSGQAIIEMEKLLDEKLPNNMGYSWTGTAFQEKMAGSQTIGVFLLSILLVYLVLCAQYESWLLPVGVILAVPLALLGTIIALFVTHIDLNVYGQIGLVLLVALASKNAILIVEFAKEETLKGKSIIEAAKTSASLRLRPILMTSFAFILGVYPLVIASGAAAASRKSLGTAVFGGMIAATFMTVLFVPFFFSIIEKISSKKMNKNNNQNIENSNANTNDLKNKNENKILDKKVDLKDKKINKKSDTKNNKEKETIIKENEKLKNDLDILKKAFKIIAKDE